MYTIDAIRIIVIIILNLHEPVERTCSTTFEESADNAENKNKSSYHLKNSYAASTYATRSEIGQPALTIVICINSIVTISFA